MDDTGNKQSTLAPQIVLTNPALRWLLIVLGWFLVMLGVIGIFIPGLPTTVFIIMAVWAFSRSSEKFHHWLWFHPRMGPSVRNWYTYRVIPISAKKLAIATMTLSLDENAKQMST